MLLSEKEKYLISLRNEPAAWSASIYSSTGKLPKANEIIKLFYNGSECGIYRIISADINIVQMYANYGTEWVGGHKFSPDAFWSYKNFLLDKESVNPHWE